MFLYEYFYFFLNKISRKYQYFYLSSLQYSSTLSISANYKENRKGFHMLPFQLINSNPINCWCNLKNNFMHSRSAEHAKMSNVSKLTT